MNWLPLALLFCTGILLGLILYPLARILDWDTICHLLDDLARIVSTPFTLLGRLFQKSTDFKKAAEGIGKEVARKVDPREQQISDSAQTIKSILLILASVIRSTDQAANASNQTLGDVRDTIDRITLPDNLMEVHALLMHEIDRMITSNTTLERELDRSQLILASQREQIESLRTEVRIDGLTQVANRVYFDEKLSEMIKLRQRYSDPFSLMMVDVDNFKDINDTHGHQAGDRILKGVSFKMKSALRDSDFVARFGGDEFAVILIKAGEKAAIDVAWKVCTNVRESRFILDGTEVKTTVSIGVAEALAGESAEDLLKRADAALYRVKNAGRNGVDADHLPQETVPQQEDLLSGR